MKTTAVRVATLAALLLTPGSGFATGLTSISWNADINFDHGALPAVAVGGYNSQTPSWPGMVSVHQGNPGTIWWDFTVTPTIRFANYGEAVTTGCYNPAIASGTRISWVTQGLSFWYIVVCEDGQGHLVYRVLDSNLGTWTTPVQYASGYRPSIAGDGLGNLIEVHQAAATASALTYRTGWLSDNGSQVQVQLDGGAGTQYESTGRNPSVGYGTNSFVIEVHEKNDTAHDLIYHSGYCFGVGAPITGFGTGAYVGVVATNPSVIASSTGSGGFVVLAYEGLNGALVYRTANENSFDTIGPWSAGTFYTTGYHPRLSIQNGAAVSSMVGIEVHQASPGTGDIQLWQKGFVCK